MPARLGPLLVLVVAVVATGIGWVWFLNLEQAWAKRRRQAELDQDD